MRILSLLQPDGGHSGLLRDAAAAAGHELVEWTPGAGEPMPGALGDFDGVAVFGGGMNLADQGRLPWLTGEVELLRDALERRMPVLGICLGAQLLASAHGGLVERSTTGPEIGPGLVARRDAADTDPLFRHVPYLPDVVQWHSDEITELPLGAVLLAASTRYPHQAFRLGDRAWGLQFHIECDPEMLAAWARSDSAVLDELGYDPELVVAATADILGDVEESWQPLAARFASLALGTLPNADIPNPGTGNTLPLLGH
jgi:GMP synthase-like glutamine amidotransferase